MGIYPHPQTFVIMVAICGGDAELMKQQQAARGMKIMYPELMYEKGRNSRRASKVYLLISGIASGPYNVRVP